jgi:cytochrome P450
MRSALDRIEDALASGTTSRDPHTTYRELRERAPLYWSASLEQWLVTSFELVEHVLMQPVRFSSYGGDSRFIAHLGDDARSFPTLVHHFEQFGLPKSDPPQHTRLRRAVRAPFSVHAVSRLAETIQGRVDALLHSAGDRFDVTADFARPLTISVISDLLGVPEQDRGQFQWWAASWNRFFGTPRPTVENAAVFDEALTPWRALLVRLFAERQATPRDDLLSHVANQIRLGELSLEEALFTCVHLMIGGHETTTSAIGTTMLCLLTHPDEMAAVQRSPDLVAAAIEEAIRLETPVLRSRRTATQDCEVDGQLIKAGDVVMPVFAAANRDPARFERPDEYLLDRDFHGLHHETFGRGTHFCLGAPLARLEAQIAVTTLLRRFPDVRTANGFEPRWQASLGTRALESMPVEVLAQGGLS